MGILGLYWVNQRPCQQGYVGPTKARLFEITLCGCSKGPTEFTTIRSSQIDNHNHYIQTSEHWTLKKRRVALLHRTVRDFLPRKDLRAFFLEQLQGHSDPIAYLSNAIVAFLKTVPWTDIQNRAPLGGLLDAFIWYACQAELQGQHLNNALLDETEKAFYNIANKDNLSDYISARYTLQQPTITHFLS